MYHVNEIFYTLQGEGAHSGIPAVFVRFSGCNLRCPWCDTDFADHTDMTAEQIVSEALALYDIPNERRKMLVLTGGEPSLQVDKRFACSGILYLYRDQRHPSAARRNRLDHLLTQGRAAQ